MSAEITTKYDDEIEAYVVRMPDYITYNNIERWLSEFSEILASIDACEKTAVLIDTNLHQFESIGCLKLWKEASFKTPFFGRTFKIATVQPRHYRKPEVVSSDEAHFSDFEDAYKWLSQL